MVKNFLKELKENDIVMMEIPSMVRTTLKQICRIYNLKFIPVVDESLKKYADGWLYFDGEVLYTNFKLHKSMAKPMGNCMSITEKITPKHLEQLSRVNDMWKADLYLLSDAEMEHKRNTMDLKT